MIIQDYGEECKHPVVAGPATVGCGLLRNRDKRKAFINKFQPEAVLIKAFLQVCLRNLILAVAVAIIVNQTAGFYDLFFLAGHLRNMEVDLVNRIALFILNDIGRYMLHIAI